MPYSAQHKLETRGRIVEAARRLFNRQGFDAVTIDGIMAEAGLTRGGFYNHFKSKDELYSEAVLSFIERRRAQATQEPEDNPCTADECLAVNVLHGYLSDQHLENIDEQCPMIALPSDLARAGPSARGATEVLVTDLIAMFEGGQSNADGTARERAVAMATLCVGSMILARAIDNKALQQELRDTALNVGLRLNNGG